MCLACVHSALPQLCIENKFKLFHKECSWNLGKPLRNTIHESLRTKTGGKACLLRHLKSMKVG